MAKTKTAYVCTECGADYSKWQGQCTACQAWNTISEVRGVSSNAKGARGARFEGFAGSLSEVQSLDDISLAEQPRISSGMQEFDRVLGGGLVEGSAVLMGGHPGAGKSTLLLQAVCHLAATVPALYVTGEESLQQVAMRAKRLGLPTKDLKMLSETSVERVMRRARADVVGGARDSVGHQQLIRQDGISHVGQVTSGFEVPDREHGRTQAGLDAR